MQIARYVKNVSLIQLTIHEEPSIQQIMWIKSCAEYCSLGLKQASCEMDCWQVECDFVLTTFSEVDELFSNLF